MSDREPRIPAGPILLAVTCLAGGLLRLPGLTRSLGHDEIYTRVIFASRSVGDILTSYDLPNNHILHTLLVRLAVALFGDAEWAQRLPALLAGVAGPPVLFAFARRLTGSAAAGLFAAALLALSTLHIGFSQQARGYSLLVLLCLLHGWALLSAIDQLRAGEDPPDREGLPWLLAAITGSLAVLTLPSAAFFVGACAFGTVARIRFDLPASCSLRARIPLALVTGAVVATAGLIYLPRVGELYAHAERFGVPLTLATWPGFVADVWHGIGPARGGLLLFPFALAALLRLLWMRRGAGLFLACALGLPLLFSLALSTGGQPRVYLYLLPVLLTCVAIGLDELRTHLQALLPGGAAPIVATLVLLLPAGFAVGDVPSAPMETGYRDAGRWVHDHTSPGDAVVVPYIMDSAIGYYADGATVQRLRDLATEPPRRLLLVERPGTPRFASDGLMLAQNYTTQAAGHADTYTERSFPVGGFAEVVGFGPTRVLASAPLQPVDLGNLTSADSWRLVAQAGADSATWATGEGFAGAPSLRLVVPANTRTALRTKHTFRPDADGLLLLVCAKRGAGYASLLEETADGPQARQMAKVLSAGANLPDGEWTAEAYLHRVSAGVAYGLFVSSDTGQLDLSRWSLRFLPDADGA
jgi:hypothetical protein